MSDFGGIVTHADQPQGGGVSKGRILHRRCDYSAPESYRRTRRHQNLTPQMARCCENARAIFNEMPTALSPGVPPETLPVLLRSHIDLPHRAFRKHLGATAE